VSLWLENCWISKSNLRLYYGIGNLKIGGGTMRAVIDDAYRNHKRLARITISDEHNTTVVSMLADKVHVIPMVSGYIIETFKSPKTMVARIIVGDYEDYRKLK
jgi:hypothetical protein